MDFLDPKKQKAHRVRLTIGYALLGVALLLGTVILLFQAYGFGVDRNGQVIQNGLVFFSSQPNNASIYVNGVTKDTTNTRLQLPAGTYNIELRESGYRTWKRAIGVDGGKVERFDYPFLFPSKLTTTTVKQYTTAPLLETQSPDHRWLMVQSLSPDQFDLYDLSASKPSSKPLVVPTDALVSASTTTGWAVEQWGGDNRHVLLRRTYQKAGQPGVQYVLFDHQDPTTSQNMTQLFGFTPTSIALQDGHYDEYYLYDQGSSQLFTATLKKPTPEPFISNVLAYTVSQDRILYVNSQDASKDKVLVKLRSGDKTYTVRQLPAQTNYVLAVGSYSGDWLVAAGAASDNKVYVYLNPDTALSDNPGVSPVPVQLLKINAPTFLDLSPNSRFVMAESADQFAIYDAETTKSYRYAAPKTLDAPQAHVTWMDGYHMQLVSGGKFTVFDFDGANMQSLSAAAPAYLPVFNGNYQLLYALTAQNALTSTSLVVK